MEIYEIHDLFSVITVVISERRSKIRRKLNETDNERSATSVDSILNYETVSSLRFLILIATQ